MTLLNADGLRAKGIDYHPSHLCRLVKAKKFPAPIKVGGGRNSWLESEIDAYIASKAAERDQESA